VSTGLDFSGNWNFTPGNQQTPNTPMFGWNAANFVGSTNPFAAYPATYIWRAYPRDQDSFWSMLFHADYTAVFTGTERYYGMHPYPNPPDLGPATWEISSHGGDVLGQAVTLNQWYTCVAVVFTGAPDDNEDFYPLWPDTTTGHIANNAAIKSNAASPAIIIGDAPWNRGFEAPNAILRGFQFYDTNLSLTDIQSEIDNPGSVRTPWYINLDPTPNDISDKSGAGHNPAWLDANRPALWESSNPTAQAGWPFPDALNLSGRRPMMGGYF